MDNKAFGEFLTKAFKNLSEILKAGGAFYIWFASREHINFEKALNENGLKVRQEIIWNKNMFILKPIKLLSRLIKNSSRIDECVVDLFGGSGSTLIACEQLSRPCYMMELDPKYCDVIVKRWETLTGKKAELEKK